MEKLCTMQIGMYLQQKNTDSKKESNGNARNEKHSPQIINTFHGLMSTFNTAKERISEFEAQSTEISHTEIQREKLEIKSRKEYLR